GLYAGLVIAVLSVSGVAALFKVEIDEAINANYFKISANQETTDFYPDLNPLIDSLKSEYGESNFAGIIPSIDRSKNWIILFNVVKREPYPVGYAYQVFFNPYTGKVVGVRDRFKTFSHYIRQLHVRLFNGFLGRWWVGLGGIALLVSTVTGILIYGHFMKRQFFGAIRNKNLKLKSADYHKIIGMTTLMFNLMIAITGAWLGLQSILQPALLIESPERYKKIEKSISKEEDIKYTVDYIKAFKTSRELFPDLIPKSIRPSKSGSRTISVTGNVPRTAYQNNINSIVLDKRDYREVRRYDVRVKSVGDKAFYAQEGLHYGDFGGVWIKVIYSFFGLTSGVLSILGFVLYLERTKSKQKEKVNYKTTGKKVWLWSLWTTAFCVLLYILTITVGASIPTLVITLAIYGALLFYLIKPVIVFSKRKYKALIKKEGTF
ncbi:MAG: PepSY-associated TM helix domain-containing protein, partial [Bacteroidota bacterium]